MKHIIYYTDQVGMCFLDQLTGLEYFCMGSVVWESREAGEVLIKTLHPVSQVEMRKREG